MSEQLPKATFVYDGDCGICREWVNYWRQITGDTVEYRPYQEAAADYPQIRIDDLEQSVHLIETDGSIRKGAEATFSLYTGRPPHSLLPWLYHHLPGFAALSEGSYRFFARHRKLLACLTRLFWGRDMKPVQYSLTRWLFLRLLGCVYLAAFASLGLQITGLIGSNGILPLTGYLDALQEHYGYRAWLQAPMIFWLHAGNGFLQLVCWGGAVLSLLVIFNRCTVPALLVLFGLYLSLFHAGQVFTGYQWDLLLLEAGFLAILLPTGSAVVIWLYRWLAFRFLFLSGIVKILSGDQTWDSLRALHFHFETQPLPTPLAWYAHHLPDRLLTAATAATLIIEVVLVFLIFAPRRFRLLFAWLVIAFQSSILLTGNYNFFNFLTIGLCLFLMDDAHIRSLMPGKVFNKRPFGRTRAPGKRTLAMVVLIAVMVIYSGVEQFVHMVGGGRRAETGPLTELLQPLHIVNSYGLFAVMTTLRHEIVIEGTSDGRAWQAYEFKYKPGDPGRAPPFNIPHQPRLDWQMWFAALRDPDRTTWFGNFLVRLLQDEPAVTKLLADNPFPVEPPRAVRARFYEYHFTTPAQAGSGDNWWQRTLVGDYYPAIALRQEVRNGGD